MINANNRNRHYIMNSKVFSEKPLCYLRNKDIKKWYSKKFPSGLPFEDEFYHKRRERSISSKSVPSDYGSFENDNDNYHSQSLLPFEEEIACQRLTSEALFVDFSKLLYEKRTNSIKNNISNIKSNSDNLVLNEAYRSIFSNVLNENNTLYSGAITICNQPVIYVQWSSKQMRLHKEYDKVSNRYDKV